VLRTKYSILLFYAEAHPLAGVGMVSRKGMNFCQAQPGHECMPSSTEQYPVWLHFRIHIKYLMCLLSSG